MPLATTEGTLVASYSRGMKLCREAGGMTTTVLDDRMQRAPVFSFESARGVKAFRAWLDEHFEEVAAAAQETTTRSGGCIDIQKFSVSKLLYTRFNYTTGDAAGQNMTGKATFAACAWIKQNYPRELHFLLEGQFATDKKTSLGQHAAHARQAGRRRDHAAARPGRASIWRRPPRSCHGPPDRQPRRVHVGVNNNGLHSANAITAMFIATGQDVANVRSSRRYVFPSCAPRRRLLLRR